MSILDFINEIIVTEAEVNFEKEDNSEIENNSDKEANLEKEDEFEKVDNFEKEIWSDDIYYKEKKIVKNILEDEFEDLKKDSIFWTPEAYWMKIKSYTGVDIDNIILSYLEEPIECAYICHNCKRSNLKKQVLVNIMKQI